MPDSPSQSSPAWIDRIRDAMCRLFQAFGHACSELQWNLGDAQAIGKIRAAFEGDGLPSFANATEEQDFRDLLAEIQTLSESPDSTYTAELTTQVQTLLSDITAALDA